MAPSSGSSLPIGPESKERRDTDKEDANPWSLLQNYSHSWFDTSNGNSTPYSCKSPFALRDQEIWIKPSPGPVMRPMMAVFETP
jgi:hypothetical protein